MKNQKERSLLSHSLSDNGLLISNQEKSATDCFVCIHAFPGFLKSVESLVFQFSFLNLTFSSKQFQQVFLYLLPFCHYGLRQSRSLAESCPASFHPQFSQKSPIYEKLVRSHKMSL